MPVEVEVEVLSGAKHKKTAADRGLILLKQNYFLASAAGAAVGAAGATAGASFLASSA
jgi:hypothetical protein